MDSTAIALADDSRISIIDEGVNKPSQPNGLAYVWGSKRTDVRKSSSSSPASNDQGAYIPPCGQLLYGLDCSGFIYQLALSANITLTNDIEKYGECFKFINEINLAKSCQ